MRWPAFELRVFTSVGVLLRLKVLLAQGVGRVLVVIDDDDLVLPTLGGNVTDRGQVVGPRGVDQHPGLTVSAAHHRGCGVRTSA